MKKQIHPIPVSVLLLTLMLAVTLPVFTHATKHVVNVQNFSFSPASITNVQVGDTIRWVWVSGTHTTTSSTIPAGALTWDSPITSSVTSFEYRVEIAGMYNYVCTPHAAGGMVGSFTASAGPTLNVTPANQNVTSTAGNTTFAVTSNSNWTASSNQTWCTVTPSGNGNGSITANYSANMMTSVRVASITVTVAGLSPMMVTVTQAAAAATLSVSPANQDVDATAGSTNFVVTSNSGWTATSSETWCTITPSGNGNGTINAAYTENTSLDARMATISVTVAGLPVEMVTVSQSGAALVLEIDPISQMVSYEAGSADFAVVSNADWMTVSDADWCTVTPSGSGNGVINAAFSENMDISERTAIITVTVSGFPSLMVTLTQGGSTISVKDVDIEGFNLYPNPAKEYFTINTKALSGEKAVVSVLSMDGSLVLRNALTVNAETRIDVSGLKSGNYIVSLVSEREFLKQRLVIIK